MIARLGMIKARVERYTTCSCIQVCTRCPERFITVIIKRVWLPWMGEA